MEEIIAVMRAAGEDRDGIRLRGLIVVLWRAGLRISEALALAESDLDPDRGSILVRRGKRGRRREVWNSPDFPDTGALSMKAFRKDGVQHAQVPPSLSRGVPSRGGPDGPW
ncbi:MAG: tyrosine-type recombinase/integrase, partial [Solirubrobacteraceae bacterium]